MRMHEKIALKRNRFGIWGRFRVIHVKNYFLGQYFHWRYSIYQFLNLKPFRPKSNRASKLTLKIRYRNSIYLELFRVRLGLPPLTIHF